MESKNETQSRDSPLRLLAFYCLLPAAFYNRVNGRESIQIPFPLLSLLRFSLSACVFVCACVYGLKNLKSAWHSPTRMQLASIRPPEVHSWRSVCVCAFVCLTPCCFLTAFCTLHISDTHIVHSADCTGILARSVLEFMLLNVMLLWQRQPVFFQTF